MLDISLGKLQGGDDKKMIKGRKTKENALLKGRLTPAPPRWGSAPLQPGLPRKVHASGSFSIATEETGLQGSAAGTLREWKWEKKNPSNLLSRIPGHMCRS